MMCSTLEGLVNRRVSCKVANRRSATSRAFVDFVMAVQGGNHLLRDDATGLDNRENVAVYLEHLARSVRVSNYAAAAVDHTVFPHWVEEAVREEVVLEVEAAVEKFVEEAQRSGQCELTAAQA